MIELIDKKVCRICGKEYPDNTFFRQTRKPYPYRDGVCKFCRDEQRVERRRVHRKRMLNLVLTIWFLFVGICFAEPVMPPFEHWVQYARDAKLVDTEYQTIVTPSGVIPYLDIGSVYMRFDGLERVWPRNSKPYYEGTGRITYITRRGGMRFFALNWLNKTDPNGPCLDYHWFNTYAKNYRGGLRSVPLVKPAEPNAVEPTPYRIAATTKEGGVYHLPTCRYVTETAKAITIKQAALYRPCSVCRPDDPIELLKSILPAEIVGEMWMNQE